MISQVNNGGAMTRWIFALTCFLAPAASRTVPTITTTSETVAVSRGQDALLTCTASSLGTAVLSWEFAQCNTFIFHGQQLMVDDTRYSLLHSKGSDRYDLRITSVRVSDQGMYRCGVTDRPGVFIHLVVTDSEIPPEPSESSRNLLGVNPDPPEDVTLIQTFNNGSYGIVVTWQPPTNNPESVTGYRINYKQNNDTLARSTAALSSTSESFTISPVTANTRYTIRVTSLGLLGCSEPSNSVDIVVEERHLLNESDILSCCQQHSVPAQCQSTLCHSTMWSTLNDSSLLFNDCLMSMEYILVCLAGGRNHTGCCVANNVPETCTGLCSGQPLLKQDSFPQCQTKFPIIDACIQSGISSLPTSPRRLTLFEVNIRSANIGWEASDSGTAPVTHFIIQLRQGSELSPWKSVGTARGTEFHLTNLAAVEDYSVRVIAVNSAGESIPSMTVDFTTYPEQTLRQERRATFHNFTQCCMDKSLPDVCLAACTSNHTFRNMMDHFFTNKDICLQHIGNIISCASDGRDHSYCCERSGIRDHCLDLCSYTDDSPVDLRYTRCLDDLSMATTMTCYLEGLTNPPRAPHNVTVSTIAARNITVQWQVPQRGPSPTSYYITCRSIKTNEVQTGETTMPMYILKNLEPGTGYKIMVYSVMNGSYSLASPLITAYTLADTVKPDVPDKDKGGTSVWKRKSQCCKESGMSSACLPLCLNKPVDNRTNCSKEAPKILTCATDGKDHRTCCQQAGLRSDCLPLCNGAAEGHPDVPPACMAKDGIEIITSCYLQNTGLLPKTPARFRVLREMDGRIVLTWDSSDKCSASGTCVFDVYYWNDVDLMNRKVITNVTSPYLVTEVLDNLQYTFTVAARNSNGSSVAAPWQTLLLKDVDPDVSIGILPSDVSIFDRDTSIVLVCDAFNFDDNLTYTWAHGKQLMGSGRFQKIDNVTAEQEGFYSCTASTNNISSMAVIFLNVRYAPFLENILADSVRINNGSQGVLACWFRGHPFTNMSSSSWEKDGQPISDPRYKVFSMTNYDTGVTYLQLKIEDLVPSDYGVYMCMGYNQYGSTSGQVTFTESDLISTPVTPVTPTQNASGNATECCMTVDVPDLCLPFCSHTNNISALLDNNTYESCMDHLPDIIRCDAGTDDFDHTQCCQESGLPQVCWPVCSGQGSLANSSQSEYLDCLPYATKLFYCFEGGTGNLPSPPTEVSATLTPHAINVTWRRPAKNKDKVTWYRVNIASSTNARTTQHVLTKEFLDYAISDIAPGSSYKIWIVAGNEMGSSQASDAVNITVPEDFEPESSHIQGDGTHDNTFTVPVLAGVVVAVVAVVAAIAVTVFVICRRQSRGKLAMDAVSFENPSYGSECVRIGTLPASALTEEPTDSQVLAADDSSGSFQNSGFKEDEASNSSNQTSTA